MIGLVGMDYSFQVDGVDCRVIPLSKGYYALVWDSDYEWLMQWKWCAILSKKRRAIYAIRNTKDDSGKRCQVRMHRELLGVGRDRKVEIDHENCDSLDNRRSNLRSATHQQNRWNTGKFRNNTSGYKGVSWCHWKKKWVARIGADGKYIRIGYDNDPAEAYKLVCDAAQEYHQKFARVA